MPVWLMKMLKPAVRVQHPDFAIWEQRTSLNLVPMTEGDGWAAWFGTYPHVHAFHPTAEGAVQDLCRFLFERGGCDAALKENTR
jgi:hypothetical protein